MDRLARWCHPTDPPTVIDAPHAVEWDHLLSLADEHGVVPLVARRLRSADGVPVPLEDRLSAVIRSHAAIDLAMQRALARVADILDAAEVRWLAFKGPVLDTAVYGGGARAYGDLDLLVHRDDIEAAVEALRRRGLEADPSAPPPAVALAAGWIRPPMAPEYTLSMDDIEVELRPTIGDSDQPFRPGFDELYRRRSAIELDGRSIPSLAPPDRLLMLAFHGTKHGWHRLKWVVDFAWPLNTVDDTLLARAEDTGNRRRVLVGTAIGMELMDVTAPPALEAALATDPTAQSLADTVVGRLRQAPHGRPSSMWRLLLSLRAADTTAQRTRMLARWRPLHPSVAEYEAVRLPPSMFWFYYLLRPLRVAALLIGR